MKIRPGIIDMIYLDVKLKIRDMRKMGASLAGMLLFIASLEQSMLEKIAGEKNKIPVLTDFGYVKVPDSSWLTNVLFKALERHKISYALVWRNAGARASGEAEYYLPFKGQVSEKDFIRFYNEPKTLSQKDITKERLYK